MDKIKEVWNWAKEKWNGLNKQLKWFIIAIVIAIVLSWII